MPFVTTPTPAPPPFVTVLAAAAGAGAFDRLRFRERFFLVLAGSIEAGAGAAATEAVESVRAGGDAPLPPLPFTAGAVVKADPAAAAAAVAAAEDVRFRLRRFLAAAESGVAAPFDCDFESVAVTDFAVVVTATGVGAAAAVDFDCGLERRLTLKNNTTHHIRSSDPVGRSNVQSEEIREYVRHVIAIA